MNLKISRHSREQTCLGNVLQSNNNIFKILFWAMLQHPVANQTLLEDNDNLVTKHMGQATQD